MPREPLRNARALRGGQILTLVSAAVLLSLGARSLQAQSLRPYTLFGPTERVAPTVSAPFRLEHFQPMPSVAPALTSLAAPSPDTVQGPAWAQSARLRSAQGIGRTINTRECPMRIARTDSSHSRGMPVMLADSAITRADVGGALIGCTNPLQR